MLNLTWFGWILVAVCVFVIVFGVFYIVNGVIQIHNKRKKIKQIRGGKRA